MPEASGRWARHSERRRGRAARSSRGCLRRGAELINAPKIVGRDGGEEETLVVGKCVDKDVMMSSFAVVLKLSTTKVRRLLASYGFIPVKHLKRRKLSDRYRMFYGMVLRESKKVLPMHAREVNPL